jgi:hypothetical protein
LSKCPDIPLLLCCTPAPTSSQQPAASMSSLPTLPPLKKQRTEGDMVYEEHDHNLNHDSNSDTHSINSNTTNYKYRTRIKNAKQLVLVATNTVNSSTPWKRGAQMNSIEIIQNGAMIIDNSGIIVAVDTEQAIAEAYDSKEYSENLYETVIDATNLVVLPGLVDGKLFTLEFSLSFSFCSLFWQILTLSFPFLSC